MKVPDIGFPQDTHPTTYEFYGWVRNVLNEGRYQLRVISDPPTWTTNDGEMLCVDEGTSKSLYMFITNAWYSVPLTQAGLGGMVPTGCILPYCGTTTNVPSGWALCNGAAASRTTYAQLFGVIGTAFGSGDGSTTFNLPDLRGRYPLGCDNIGSAANRVTIEAAASTVGGGGGNQNMQQHFHWIGHAGGGGGGIPFASGGPGAFMFTDWAGTGSSQNMPPYQTVLYIIKL